MRSKLPSARFTHLMFYYYLPGRLCYSLLPERCMRIIVLGLLHIVFALCIRSWALSSLRYHRRISDSGITSILQAIPVRRSATAGNIGRGGAVTWKNIGPPPYRRLRRMAVSTAAIDFGHARGAVLRS